MPLKSPFKGSQNKLKENKRIVKGGYGKQVFQVSLSLRIEKYLKGIGNDKVFAECGLFAIVSGRLSCSKWLMNETCTN